MQGDDLRTSLMRSLQQVKVIEVLLPERGAVHDERYDPALELHHEGRLLSHRLDVCCVVSHPKALRNRPSTTVCA